MDNFKYRLKIEAINKLTTKKSIKEVFTELLYANDSVNGFKALTYVLYRHPDKIVIGTGNNDSITKKLVRIVAAFTVDIEDLTQYCVGTLPLTDAHKVRLLNNRYIPYQLAADILKQDA